MNHGVQSNAPAYLFSTFFFNSHSSHSPPPSLSLFLFLHFLLPLRTFASHTTAMATNALTGTSVSMCSLFRQLNHRPAFSSISGPRSALSSSFGRRNVSFSWKPHSIHLKISCNAKPEKGPLEPAKPEKAKPETVDKVCQVVKKQLALPDDHDVCGESKFSALGADSLDTVEIVMGLEEVFGISVEEDSAQSITTVQEAADLIEEIIQKKSC